MDQKLAAASLLDRPEGSESKLMEPGFSIELPTAPVGTEVADPLPPPAEPKSDENTRSTYGYSVMVWGRHKPLCPHVAWLCLRRSHCSHGLTLEG